ncbi:glycosyltransferase [Pseudomonas sp. CCM 7891]|uniref:Glycosyltransferase n=1 Tax=Pseudomonas karstica TaxID=1055468 RepID=A0A7X2RRN1_9PSED|nr:glycosyltransferase family 4 protein [Pseudomonas karstica]MTD18637.1 glycosyltransferase [Pseudomonas karstica]
MSILNVMWAGGSAFASVHKVHQQILGLAEPGASVNTWLLQGNAAGCKTKVGQVREWHLSSARLKGRHLWKLLAPWMCARFRQALPDDVEVLLLDGLGAARVLLPVLKSLPGIRAVVVFHGSTRLRRADYKLFNRFPSSRLTLVAVSQTLARSVEHDLQVPVTVLRSAFNPVAFGTALLSREQARSWLGLPLATPVLGAVGRLVSGKGFLCLLDAFAATLVDQPDLRLVIVGEGPERAVLEARIEHLGLSDKVSIPGHLHEAATLYRAFDWVAIPSSDEGLGLILQEAVMAGVPVLVSELAVFREQLADTGWYAPIGDVGAWSQTINRALGASAERIAAAQFRALAPDQAWKDFSEATQALLSRRQ